MLSFNQWCVFFWIFCGSSYSDKYIYIFFFIFNNLKQTEVQQENRIDIWKKANRKDWINDAKNQIFIIWEWRQVNF